MGPQLDAPIVGQPVPTSPVLYDQSLVTRDDLYLFNEGSHFRLYDKLGAHPRTLHGRSGTSFSVWAPNAEFVSVVGDFNGWDAGRHPLGPRENSGIWEGFIPDLGTGARLTSITSALDTGITR